MCHAALLAITAVTVIPSFSFKAHSFCQQKRIRTIPKGRNYGNVQFSSCFAIFFPSRHWHERGQLCFHVLFFVVLSTRHHFNRLVLALDLDQERVPELPSSISKQFMVCFSNVSFSPNSQDKVQRFTEENSVICQECSCFVSQLFGDFLLFKVGDIGLLCFESSGGVFGALAEVRSVLEFFFEVSVQAPGASPSHQSRTGLCWDLNTEMLADFQYFGMSWEFE